MMKRSGFTLMELLVVIVIIAILVVIAIPLYGRAIERGRTSEAYTNLGAIRNAEIRFRQQNNTFTENVDQLDIDNPNISSTQGKSYFSSDPSQGTGGGYSIVRGSATPTNFTARAARNDRDLFPTISQYNIDVDISGNFIGGP